jgi:hypothetical protein
LVGFFVGDGVDPVEVGFFVGELVNREHARSVLLYENEQWLSLCGTDWRNKSYYTPCEFQNIIGIFITCFFCIAVLVLTIQSQAFLIIINTNINILRTSCHLRLCLIWGLEWTCKVRVSRCTKRLIVTRQPLSLQLWVVPSLYAHEWYPLLQW